MILLMRMNWSWCWGWRWYQTRASSFPWGTHCPFPLSTSLMDETVIIIGPHSIFLQILISSWIGGYNTDESSAWDHQHHAIHNLHITQHPSPLSTSLQPSYYYYDQPGIIAMKILTSSVINKSAKKEQTWDDCHENSYIKCYHQISKKEENLGWGQLCSPNSSGPSG